MDTSISNHPTPTLVKEILTPKRISASRLLPEHWIVLIREVIQLIKPQLRYLSGFGRLRDVLQLNNVDSQLPFFIPAISNDLLQKYVTDLFSYVGMTVEDTGKQVLVEALLLLLSRDGELIIFHCKPHQQMRMCQLATAANLKLFFRDSKSAGQHFFRKIEFLFGERQRRLDELLLVRDRLCHITSRINFEE